MESIPGQTIVTLVPWNGTRITVGAVAIVRMEGWPIQIVTRTPIVVIMGFKTVAVISRTMAIQRVDIHVLVTAIVMLIQMMDIRMIGKAVAVVITWAVTAQNVVNQDWVIQRLMYVVRILSH